MGMKVKGWVKVEIGRGDGGEKVGIRGEGCGELF